MKGSVRGELRELLPLAGPAILSSLGVMAMSLVDTIMVGRLGPAALASVAISGAVLANCFMLFAGIQEAVVPLVSQSHGAGRRQDAEHYFWQAIWLALLSAGPLLVLAAGMEPLLVMLGQEPELAARGASYTWARAHGVPFGMIFFAQRGLLYGVGRTWPVMWVILAANALNVVANYALIFGHLGCPALGVEGAGWATAICRAFQCLAAAWCVAHHAGFSGDTQLRRPDAAVLARTVRLGLPIGLQIFLDIAVFTSVAVMAGWLDPISLAGHQIALRVVAFVFMIPMGIGSAAAVRVGHALGAGAPDRAAWSGRVAMGLTVAVTAVVSVVLWFFPGLIARAFTDDPPLVSAAAGLLVIAACYTVTDGLQYVAGSCLRGTGDTQSPLRACLVGHWMLGIPLGVWLGFVRGQGVSGLWWGITAALTVVALLLSRRFLAETWRKQPTLVAASPGG